MISLLYRVSRDGWDFSDFHSRCDGKGPTLTLFETSKGKKCGGITYRSWKSNNKPTNDSQSCIFSLDKKTKFDVQLPDKAIYCSNSYGPLFGYDTMFGAICQPQNGNNKCVCKISKDDYKVTRDESGSNLISGENGDYFTATEIECFQLIFPL